MQTWEYLYLEVNCYDSLVRVNGQQCQSLLPLLFKKGEKMWDALNRLGQEGWEAVGFSYEGSVPSGYGIIVKRPRQG